MFCNGMKFKAVFVTSVRLMSHMCLDRCSYGYFVNGTVSQTQQSVECLGQLGGWYPQTIADCYRVEGERMTRKEGKAFILCS